MSVERERDRHVKQASLGLGNLAARTHFVEEGSGHQSHVVERATGYGDVQVLDGADRNSGGSHFVEFPYLLVIHIMPLYEH